MAARPSPFETRVRLMLVLLAMVLAAANVANFLLLRSARQALRDGEGRLAAEIARQALSEAGEQALARAFTDPSMIAVLYPPTRLRFIATRQGLLSVDLIMPDGTFVSSSSPARLGEKDRAPGASGLRAASSLDGSRDRPAGAAEAAGGWTGPVEVEGQSVILHYLPLFAQQGKLAGSFRTTLASPNLARVERAYRLFAGVQAVALALAIAAAFLLSRWIARPYRLLAQAAGGAPEGMRPDPASAEDPDALVASFRAVLDKIRRQEEELRRLASGGIASSPGGDPVGGFARTIAPTMVSGVIAVNREGRVVALNPAAERMLSPPAAGTPAGAEAGAGEGSGAFGRPVEDVLGCSEELVCLVRESLVTGLARSREVVSYRTPSGGRGHLGAALSPIAAQGAWPGGVLCLVSDLSEIGSLRERARLRENLASVGQLSAGIAHEFRNSLATILGYARLIERGAAGLPAAEHGRAIAREVEAVRGSVDEFLIFARPSRLSRTRVSLGTLCAQAAQEVERDGELPALQVEVEGDLPVVLADETMLRQAFTNLFRNAAESAPGRIVRLRVRAEVSGSGDAVRIEMADDGGGILAENLDRIFLPFFTTKEKGTGLGLAIAQKTILDHDGAIEVRSRPGAGTTFEIVLPLGPPDSFRNSSSPAV